jgi:dynamin family protein
VKNELDLLRDEVLGLFPRLEARLGADLPPERREPLYRGRAALADGRFLVLVVGEFKRGKSSLLNALIEQRLFPVDADIATATVCTLSWGETPRAVVHLLPGDGDEALPPPKTIGLAEVPRYATEQGWAKGDPPVAQIDMVAPIPQLTSGLILVDTPGIGSMNPAHTAATSGFLPEADALIFVASADQPLSTPELAFLARAYEVCPIVLTAVTMIDKPSYEDEIIAEARARIAGVTGQPADRVDLVGVSALRKWNGLKEEDQALVQESGFPELEQRLWTGLVTSCAIARLSEAIDVLEAVTADSAAPLQNEKTGLAGQAALKDIDEQLKAAQAKVQEARTEAPRRSRMLADELEEHFRPIRRELTQAFDDMYLEFQQATEDRKALAEPGAVINRLVREMVDAQSRANRDLSKVVDEVAASFSERLSVPLSGLGGDVEIVPPTLLPPRIDMPTRRFASFRTVWGGATAAGAVGLIAGGLLALVFPPAAAAIGPFVAGPLIGGLVGQAAGVAGGFGQARMQTHEREDAERRRRLRGYILPRVDAARRNGMDDLTQRLRDETKALTRAMDEQLALDASSLDASRARLQQVRTRTATENDARLRQVERRLEEYQDIYQTLAEMRYRIEGLGQIGARA